MDLIAQVLSQLMQLSNELLRKSRRGAGAQERVVAW